MDRIPPDGESWGRTFCFRGTLCHRDIKMCVVYSNLLSTERRPQVEVKLKGGLGQIVRGFQ